MMRRTMPLYLLAVVAAGAAGSAAQAPGPALPTPAFAQASAIAWAPDDPADSLYRAARDALSRGEYRRAAVLFHQVVDQYPKSAYATDCAYWEAFSRYRIGTTEDLEAAAQVLRLTASRAAAARGDSDAGATHRGWSDQSEIRRQVDVATLETRIAGALAARGDVAAANEIRQEARGDAFRMGTGTGTGFGVGRGSGFQTQDPGCDQEDVMVRVEALNALNQMDPASALPMLRRVLEKKDDCSAELRRRALFMVARRGDTTATNILLGVAKTDPNASVRAEAVNWLPRMPGAGVTAALEELLRTSDDETLQRAAVRALMASDDPRARQAVRGILERKDIPVQLRLQALSSFDRDRSTPEDAAYLRGLYGKVDNDRVKQGIISAVARMGGKDNSDWLLGIVRNQGETSELRGQALMSVARTDVPIADLAKMYDAADSRNMREQLIAVFGTRKEPEATDKLIDIIKNGTDPSLKRLAINYLSRKNDPRATALLMELIEK